MGNQSCRKVLEKMRNTLLEAEKEATSPESVYQPEVPISVEVLDWVRYKHRDKYLEMLDGKEIGFRKFRIMFRNEYGY